MFARTYFFSSTRFPQDLHVASTAFPQNVRVACRVSPAIACLGGPFIRKSNCLGPYEILSAIGAGGMGEVYRARDTRLDRTVAVKVLPARVSTDRVLRDRFEREGRPSTHSPSLRILT